MFVFVKGIAFLNFAFQTMYGEVHFGEFGIGIGFLLAIKRNALVGLQAFTFDKIARLNEHPRRATRGVEDSAVVRFDDVDDGLHQ